MKTKLHLLVMCLFFLGFSTLFAQQIKNEPQKAVSSQQLTYKFVPSIAQQIKDGTFIPADPVSDRAMMGNDKRWMGNKIVPGKGSKGDDALLNAQQKTPLQQMRAPSLTFETTGSVGTPSDPTGAVGLDFYIASWNTAFRIFNKDGTPAAAAASLGTLFGEVIGDPIVLYDVQADRYIVTQFSASPNGFHVAVSQTNNPVTGGWHVYASSGFQTGAFPDYTKFSIWSDGYYVTANISGGNGQVWALERDQMLTGAAADIQAFNLPGIVIETGSFYSPQIFNVTDGNLPATGNATVVYLQDDAWAGVSNDHLKLWSINVDWATPANSTISAATEITTTDYISVFDGGSFSNLPQPAGPDVDAMQATIMNQAQFRKFGTHNSVVFNHVVNTSGTGKLAGVRWYELRQTGDGMPWTLYQEGTYCAPDGRHAWAASMAMDASGNIGMGYSSLSNSESISLRYTGRFDGDLLGVMTGQEGTIVQSTGNSGSNRYADYSHLTVDPSDDASFWFVSEYFNPNRADMVGVFLIEPPTPNDVGVLEITAPDVVGDLSATTQIIIDVYNFGTNTVSNFPVNYTINGGAAVQEMFTASLASGQMQSFTFATTQDMTAAINYNIVAFTSLTGDSYAPNDTAKVKSIFNGIDYCIPVATTGCNLDGIKKFVLGTIDADDGANGCNGNGAGYVDRRDLATDLDRAAGNNVHTLQAQQNWPGGVNVEEFSVWIDFDDSGTFEVSERLISGEFFTVAAALTDFTLTIPTGATMGLHTLRAKAIDGSAAGDILDPCSNFAFGGVHDYTVNIIDTLLGVDDFNFDNAEFEIISKDNNQYEIILKTSYTDILSFNLFNMLGQQVVFNNIKKEGDKYRYDLDMSYASSGVYIVKVGKGKSFKVGRIIVK